MVTLMFLDLSVNVVKNLIFMNQKKGEKLGLYLNQKIIPVEQVKISDLHD